jgi:hypothetical protein
MPASQLGCDFPGSCAFRLHAKARIQSERHTCASARDPTCVIDAPLDADGMHVSWLQSAACKDVDPFLRRSGMELSSDGREFLSHKSGHCICGIEARQSMYRRLCPCPEQRVQKDVWLGWRASRRSIAEITTLSRFATGMAKNGLCLPTTPGEGIALSSVVRELCLPSTHQTSRLPACLEYSTGFPLHADGSSL